MRILVAACWSMLLMLGLPAVALADCPVGEEMCMDVEPLSGPPGTVVHVQLYAACDPDDPGAVILFAAGDVLPESTPPSARLRLEPGVGEAGPKGTFVVPDLPPGAYVLLYDCPNSFIEKYGTNRTFLITGTPDTATSDLGAVPRMLIAVLGLVAAGVQAIAITRRLSSVRSRR